MKQKVPKAFTQCAGVASLILFVWATIGPVQDFAAGLPKLKDRPLIHVTIYNYAHLGRLGLRDAENQATALFAGAGLRIAWSEYLPRRHSVPSGNPASDFSVRILVAATMLRMPRILRNNALGESFIPVGMQGPLKGGIADVFYDRVLDASSEWGLCSGEVLGDAIAHELGHLLLGPRHSRKGIMKAHWTLQDGGLASKGELRFSREQVAALQRAARSLRNNYSLTVAAQH